MMWLRVGGHMEAFDEGAWGVNHAGKPQWYGAPQVVSTGVERLMDMYLYLLKQPYMSKEDRERLEIDRDAAIADAMLRDEE